jgi:hypothetical protein
MPAGLAPPLSSPERAARADLRGQIARLERQLAEVAAAAYPWLQETVSAHPGVRGGPRVLGLGELEVVRDVLVDRLALARAAATVQAERQAAARDELARMLADPPAHRGRRIANADLGLPGCTAYEVRPRLGLVGMLAGWWRVTVSSGCPLVCGP